MRKKQAKKLRRVAASLSVIQKDTPIQTIYKNLKKVHKSLSNSEKQKSPN